MEKIIIPESYKFISAFLTFRCNLNCSFCVNYAPAKNLMRDDFNEISGQEWVESLNRIEGPKEVAVSFTGGEPSLHKDFNYILNNLNPEIGIDLFTNLWWNEKKLERFIREVPPDKIDNHAPFPSIRVSYHPEQMGEGEKMLKNAKRLKETGYDIGVECVMYPSASQLEALERMAIKCRAADISFRPKSFIGVYEGKDDFGNIFSIRYGNYSKYPDSVFQEKTLEKMCKTSNLLINPDGKVYRCERDSHLMENPIGNILDKNFNLKDEFRYCNKYGQCHLCDVKVTTDNQQKLGFTLVEIKDLPKNGN